MCSSDNFAKGTDITAVWLLHKLENKYKGIYHAKTGREKKEETKWPSVISDKIVITGPSEK